MKTKKKPIKRTKPIANLVFRNVESLTPKMRRRLAEWLREHAVDLNRKDPPYKYAARFTGAFI